MSRWLPIQYRGFYDVPRHFVTTYRGQQILFSCPFDEDADEYPDFYRVYVLPELTRQDEDGNWEALSSKASQELGTVPVQEVRFDPTRRKEIESAVLDQLLLVSHAKQP